MKQMLIQLSSLIEGDHQGENKADKCDQGKDETRPEEDIGVMTSLGRHGSTAALRGRPPTHLRKRIEV
jgi:hypothetical protein